MSSTRRAGQTRSTSEGADALAGAHAGGRRDPPRTRGSAPAEGSAQAETGPAQPSPEAGLERDMLAVARGAPGRGPAPSADDMPDPADPAELDSRERMQSAKRKAAGPTKVPTTAARPKAPPPDAPPPSDPE